MINAKFAETPCMVTWNQQTKPSLKNISLVADGPIYRNGHGTVNLICLMTFVIVVMMMMMMIHDDYVHTTFSMEWNLSQHDNYTFRGMGGSFRISCSPGTR